MNNIRAISEQDGQHISLVGDNYRIIISGKDTNGEYAIIDMIVPPGGGPPPHAHPSFHESFYVVEGEVEFKTEAGTHIAQKGDLVNIPKGAGAHSFKNVCGATARLLCTVVPAGLDAFFLEVGKPVQHGELLPPSHPGKEDIEKLKGIADRYGQTIYPPDYFDR